MKCVSRVVVLSIVAGLSCGVMPHVAQADELPADETALLQVVAGELDGAQFDLAGNFVADNFGAPKESVVPEFVDQATPILEEPTTPTADPSGAPTAPAVDMLTGTPPQLKKS